MGDPYYRYPSAAPDRGNISRPGFPGYLSSEAPSLASHHAATGVASSDIQQRDINQLQPGVYGVNDISKSRVYPDPSHGGLPAGDINSGAQRWDAPVGVSSRAYPSSLGDPSSGAQRWDAPLGVSSSASLIREPGFGGVSAGASIRGYPSAQEVPNLAGHGWGSSGVSPSAGVHPEPSLGAVSATDTIRGYSSPLDIPNLVAQRRDTPVGISPSAGIHPEPSFGAVPDGGSIKGYPSPLKDPTLVGQRQDGLLGVRPGIPDSVDEKSTSMRNSDAPPDAAGESNILFVDGLPTDCTRREVGHLFRPFHGYKEIKVIHKEPRHSGDKAMVFCFVEFDDSNCAVTAMRALQGYKFDDKKPNSPALKIQFAHFPFRHPAYHNDKSKSG